MIWKLSAEKLLDVPEEVNKLTLAWVLLTITDLTEESELFDLWTTYGGDGLNYERLVGVKFSKHILQVYKIHSLHLLTDPLVDNIPLMTNVQQINSVIAMLKNPNAYEEPKA